MFRQTIAFVVLSLAGAFALVSCGDSGAGSSSNSSEPTAVPTFIRLAVTPAPTETPVPTVPPTATPLPEEFDYGPPEFPDYLDPELTDDRPDDETIFEGWSKFLRNTRLESTTNEFTTTLCSNGLVLEGGEPHEFLQKWRITRSPAISSYDWATVTIQVDIISGPWEGREWGWLTLNRLGGEIVAMNRNAGPMEVTRSETCLAL